jgi:hypothetical protein
MIESTPDRASTHSPSIALRMRIAATIWKMPITKPALHPIGGRTPAYSDLPSAAPARVPERTMSTMKHVMRRA